MQALKSIYITVRLQKDAPLHGHEPILFPFQMSNYFCYLTIHFILFLIKFLREYA